MPASIAVKICGLSQPGDVRAVADAGARYAGFVFFPKSLRNIDLETARDLALFCPAGLAKVALVVNADNAQLDAITATVPLDFLQLHGGETPERVMEIKSRYGLPIIKAVGVADADDLPNIDRYMRVADQILVDAKPPKSAELPGGNGLSFDWRLLTGRRWSVPWMLAGGLTTENVAEAIERTGAQQVDVSSGVESSPGQKDETKIMAFTAAALG